VTSAFGPSIRRSHSTNFFLNHAQMNPETVQIDFGWARNLEHPHGGFNFFESCLILVKPGSVGAVSELLDAVGERARAGWLESASVLLGILADEPVAVGHLHLWQ
jgi:hypothetical protein